jgi:hypothetical protein
MTQLSDEQRRAICQRICSREVTARYIESQGMRLLFLERVLRAELLGTEIMRLFYTPSMELSRDDMIFAWFAIISELIEKSAATGMLVRETIEEAPTPVQPPRGRRWFLRERPVSPGPPRISYEVARHVGVPVSTPYTRALGIKGYDYPRRDEDLISLHTLRLALDACLGLPISKISSWTHLAFAPRSQHEIYGLIQDRIAVGLMHKKVEHTYDELRFQAARGKFDPSVILIDVQRWAVDEALSELRPDLVRAELLGYGLRG